MTTMAMAHPRRYFSFSAVGAIAIRLPPTSSKTYASSGRDAREERVHLVTRDEEGDRARQVAPAAGHAEAPPRDARALDEVIREGAERVRAGRARGARRTGALAAVPAAQPQQLHVHLDA